MKKIASLVLTLVSYEQSFFKCVTNHFTLIGVRDIVCGVDCEPEELTNQQTTKLHSFAVSNSSYKMRSGMEWLKQRELKSRASSNMQASYDRLSTRNVCTNEGIMQFLNSFSGERTR